MDEERGQRVQAHAKAAEALDPDLERPPRSRKTVEPPHPAVAPAERQLSSLLDDLAEVEKALEREPAAAALVILIRRRVHAIWDELGHPTA